MRQANTPSDDRSRLSTIKRALADTQAPPFWGVSDLVWCIGEIESLKRELTDAQETSILRNQIDSLMGQVSRLSAENARLRARISPLSVAFATFCMARYMINTGRWVWYDEGWVCVSCEGPCVCKVREGPSNP